MKKIKIANVERFATQRVNYNTYTKTVTSTRWLFTNGVEVSITRSVMAFKDTSTYKTILITPIRGISKSYLEVSEALTIAQEIARATFSYDWEIKLYL